MVTCSPERTTPRVSPGLYVAVRISVGYGIATRAASSFSFPFIGCVLNIKADEINKNGLWWAGCTYTMAETRYCQWMHCTGNVTGQLCGLQSFCFFLGGGFLWHIVAYGELIVHLGQLKLLKEEWQRDSSILLHPRNCNVCNVQKQIKMHT